MTTARPGISPASPYPGSARTGSGLEPYTCLRLTGRTAARGQGKKTMEWGTKQFRRPRFTLFLCPPFACLGLTGWPGVAARERRQWNGGQSSFADMGSGHSFVCCRSITAKKLQNEPGKLRSDEQTTISLRHVTSGHNPFEKVDFDAEPALLLSHARRLADGRVAFDVAANNVRRYALEASTDFASWKSIATNWASGDVVIITNSATSSFYRAREWW